MFQLSNRFQFLLLKLDAARALAPNTIFVAMRDMSDFKGEIYMPDQPVEFRTIPDWMQPGEAEFATQVSAFIRLASNEHFEAVLDPINAPEHHDPHPHGPVICEILLGDSHFFTTEPFEVYQPTHVHHHELPYYPPANRVYITMRGGPIYSAILLARHQLAETHYRPRIESATLELVDDTPPQQTTQSHPHTSQPHPQTAQQHPQTPQQHSQTAQQTRQTAQQPHQTAQPPNQPTQPRQRRSKTQSSRQH